MTKTLREALLSFELFTIEIPRPKCKGLEFVPTRGRQGFYKSIRNEGHKYGVQIKNMGPKRATLPNADFWQAPTASPPQYNNENQKPPKATKVKVDANANEILPPRYPTHQYQKSQTYYPIKEECETLNEFEPEPDYDDQPISTSNKIPIAPPLPEFLLKRTIRL